MLEVELSDDQLKDIAGGCHSGGGYGYGGPRFGFGGFGYGAPFGYGYGYPRVIVAHPQVVLAPAQHQPSGNSQGQSLPSGDPLPQGQPQLSGGNPQTQLAPLPLAPWTSSDAGSGSCGC